MNLPVVVGSARLGVWADSEGLLFKVLTSLPRHGCRRSVVAQPAQDVAW